MKDAAVVLAFLSTAEEFLASCLPPGDGGRGHVVGGGGDGFPEPSVGVSCFLPVRDSDTTVLPVVCMLEEEGFLLVKDTGMALVKAGEASVSSC